jgi:C-terminal processing protease CtpA/Prc
MKRRVLASFAVLLAIACGRNRPIHDPTEGAIHLPRIGQTDQYGRADDARAIEGSDAAPRTTTPGAHGADVDQLQRLAERSWASRERHEELDGVNIEDVFGEMRKSLANNAKGTAFVVAVRKALCRLGDGHFRLDEKSAGAQRMRSGLQVDAVASSFVIRDVDKATYEGASNRPVRGDVIVKADGKPIAEWAKYNCLVPASTPAQREVESARLFSSQWRLPEEKPKPAKVMLRRPNGGTYTLSLRWRADTGGPDKQACVSGRQLDGRVGVLEIHTFACSDLARFEQELQAGITAMGRAKDVIVDVRDNPGGADDQARAAASRFLTEAPAWMRFRHHVPGQAVSAFADDPFDPGDSKPVKAKRVWVLVGPKCFSTCETFVSVMSTADHVTLVGQRTAGGVGNPKVHTLARSGLAVTVPSTEYAIPGTLDLIEGKGVEPDVEVRPTLDDVANGRDTVLDATLRRLQQ